MSAIREIGTLATSTQGRRMTGRGVWALLLLAVAAFVTSWQAGEHRRKSSPPLLQVPPAADNPNGTSRFSPRVRVAVTPEPVSSVRIAVDGPYEIRPVGSSKVLTHKEQLDPSRVVPSSTGLQIGERQFPVSRLEVVPERPPAIWVDRHQYRGTVHLFRRGEKRLLAVNVVPLHDYLASVVDSEMPRSFPAAARRAQAVAARTFVLREMEAASPESFCDVVATTGSQKYLGFQYRGKTGRRLAGESADSRRIVRETAGIVCVRKDSLFPAYYSAVCGGRTTPGEAVFEETVLSVPCDWCRPAERYRWQRRLDKSKAFATMRQMLSRDGQQLGPLRSIHPAEADPPGITRFRLNDGSRTANVLARQLRRWFPSVLPSPHFRITEKSETLVFHGRGHGHGVGLCQWGARGQAHAGRSAWDILRYYYRGSRLVTLTTER